MTTNLTKIASEHDSFSNGRKMTDSEKIKWLELAMRPDISELRPYSDELVQGGVNPVEIAFLYKANLKKLNEGDQYRCLRISRTHKDKPYRFEGVLKCSGI